MFLGKLNSDTVVSAIKENQKSLGVIKTLDDIALSYNDTETKVHELKKIIFDDYRVIKDLKVSQIKGNLEKELNEALVLRQVGIDRLTNARNIVLSTSGILFDGSRFRDSIHSDIHRQTYQKMFNADLPVILDIFSESFCKLPRKSIVMSDLLYDSLARIKCFVTKIEENYLGVAFPRTAITEELKVLSTSVGETLERLNQARKYKTQAENQVEYTEMEHNLFTYASFLNSFDLVIRFLSGQENDKNPSCKHTPATKSVESYLLVVADILNNN